MILVDTALRQREADDCPIRVAMVGAGFMARGIVRQICLSTPGMKLVAVANRHLDAAHDLFVSIGIDHIRTVETHAQVDASIADAVPAITDDPFILVESDQVDAIIEVTGSIDYAAHVVCHAIDHGKHVILMNAELDGTIGPLLKRRADNVGVIYTNCGGDQPGVIMDLYRFVTGIGLRPVLCGNIKGLQDTSRNPTTQQSFAAKWGQKPKMVTAFADGTKISFEQAIVANATNMRVAQRGMLGPNVAEGTPISEAVTAFPEDLLLKGNGIVDYIVGASPAPGVFVLGTIEDPDQRRFLELYKLGKGPIYCFYTPYHLCHFEVPVTVARAVLFEDATITPFGPPCVEVVATAKTDLQAGTELDGIGGYNVYGQCANADDTRQSDLLPMGLAEGCRLLKPVKMGSILRTSDVAFPPERLVDRLRAEQESIFAER